MSFILDALKKAEHARPPASMPQMPAVSVAAAGLSQRRPRSGWIMLSAGALITLAVAVIGWQLLRDRGTETAGGQVEMMDAQSGTTGLAAADNQFRPAASIGGAGESVPAPRAEVRPLDSEARAGQVQTAPAAVAQATSIPAAPSAANGATSRPRRIKPGTVVYENAPPAQNGSVQYQRNFDNEPAPVATDSQAAPASAPGNGAEQSYRNVRLSGSGLPDLHMDIHVYSQVVGNRFVFVNSRKYRQGQTTREGVLIEAITPTGATMSYRGERFEMARN